MVLLGRSLPLLPGRLRLPAAVIACLCLLTVIVLALRFAHTAMPTRLDALIAYRVEASLQGHPVLIWTAIQVGDPKTVITMAVVLAMLCAILRRWALAVLAIAAPAAVGVTTTTLKPLLGRTIDGMFAFPSGHTAGVTAISIVAALLVIALVRASLTAAAALLTTGVPAVAALVGIALVADGSHYPTDIIGGFCTSVAIVTGLVLLLDGAMEAQRRLVTTARTPPSNSA